MARYESIIKIRGCIDDLVFYQLNGVNVVRKKSGFNSSDFKKKSSYKKVRENSSEFGHCSKSGKMIRNALGEYIKDCGDQYLYQKFAKVMTQIKELDSTSERGKRSVKKGLEDYGSRSILQNFRFGNYGNVQNELLKTDSLFSVSIQKISKSNCDEIELVTLKPDFINYTAEMRTQTIPVKARTMVYEFDKHFEDSPVLLYFSVMKREGKILKLGFI